MIFVTIIVFILIFSTLVLVHEWGHFYMARKFGIKVDEFGIGLPPRAKALFEDKKGTVYSLNWIPFGGYVRLHGEDSSDPEVLKDKQSFATKTKLQRTAVIVAGVFMNFVLAWVLLTIGFAVGMKPVLVSEDDVKEAQAAGLAVIENQLYVADIDQDSPLFKAGLKKEDMIVSINNQPTPLTKDLAGFFEPNETVTLDYVRGEEKGSVSVKTDAEAKLGFTIVDARKIVQSTVQYPLHVAAWESFKEVGRLSYLTLEMLGGVVVSLVAKLTVPEGVAGPVGIFNMTQEYTKQGVVPLLQFTALLSISLGVINIMPFPALDGGRFLFIVIETIIRRRPSAKWEGIIHGIGFILLMLLILVITWNDIRSLF